MNVRFFYAVATLSGTIIGAGIFALPYVIAQVGFWIGIGYMFVLMIVSMILMFAYLEIVLSTKGLHHQLAGYARRYLGKGGETVAAIAQIVGQYGAILVFTTAAGEVLHILLGEYFGGRAIWYGIAFAIVCSIFIFIGVRMMKKIELALLVFVIVAVIFIFFYGLPHVETANLSGSNLGNIMVPFGVVLFAFSGVAAITVMDDILAGDKKKLKSAAFWGMIIPFLLYIVFVFTAMGVNGFDVTEDAIVGLSQSLGLPVLIIGSAMLLLTISTSFFTIGFSLKEVFQYDLKLGKVLGWVLMIGVPIILYVMDIGGFATLVGFSGAFLVGVQGLVIFTIFLKIKRKREKEPECSFKFPKPLIYILMAVFIFGVAAEIFRLLA